MNEVNFIVKKYAKSKDVRNRRINNYYKNTKINASKSGYLNYILRKDACFDLDITDEEWKELKDKDLSEVAHIKRLKETKKSIGLWSKDGLVTKQKYLEIEKSFQDLSTTPEQYVWDTVISFKDSFANKYDLTHPEVLHKVLGGRLEQLFSENELDPLKMEWGFAFHKNTDNPHAHLFFFEKEPTLTNEKYKYRYNLDKKSMEKFKFNVAKDISLQHTNTEINNLLRKNLIDSFKEEYNESSIMSNKTNINLAHEIYATLGFNFNMLKEKITILKTNNKLSKVFSTKIKYNSRDFPKELKDDIDKITKIILEGDEEINKSYGLYVEQVTEYQEVINELNNKPNDTGYIENSLFGEDGVYSRVGNHIINTMYEMKYLEDKKNNNKMDIITPEYADYKIDEKKENSLLFNMSSKLKKFLYVKHISEKSAVEKTKKILFERKQKELKR